MSSQPSTTPATSKPAVSTTTTKPSTTTSTPVEATEAVDYEQQDEEYTEENGEDVYGEDDDLDALEAQLEEAEATNEALENQITRTGKAAEEIQKERQKLEEERIEKDERSIFISGLDWNLTAKEISDFFSNCGSVARVTIKQDQYGQSKGIAYVEFETKDAANNSLILDGTELKGRKLHIVRKRTNVPAFQRGGRGGARGNRSRGRGGPMRGGRGGFPNPAAMMMMLPAFMAGMGGGFPRGGFMPRGPWRGAPRGGGRGGRGRGGANTE